MRSLVELQRAVRDALLSAPTPGLLDEIAGDRVTARQRLQVYRDHYRVSLKQGLEALYPATRALLGERFFDAVAGLYVTTRPPRDPRLAVYGEDFAACLSRHDALAELAWVVDVARLEWALATTAAAAVVPVCPFADLDRAFERHGDRFSLRLAPSAALFASPWQVQTIRRCALGGGSTETAAAAARDPQALRLLLHRDADGEVCELVLDRAGDAALRALRAGRTVAEAGDAARAAQPAYPLPALLAFLFEAGLVAGVGATVHAPCGRP